MIKEFEFYHGTALARLIHGHKEFRIKTFNREINAGYVLNDKVGIYIKYSTSRLSPWKFSFAKKHQDEILEMRNKLDQIFLVLVCNHAGVVTLSHEELKQVLDEEHKEYESIGVWRSRRQQFTVKGSDGLMQYKIAENEYPAKIINVLGAQDRANVLTRLFQ